MEKRAGQRKKRWIRTGLAGLGAVLLTVTVVKMIFWSGIIGTIGPTFESTPPTDSGYGSFPGLSTATAGRSNW
ncbi:MAG: hypothetical protein U5K28_03040 [Halobacteriales archaeon]|nr:hypothetical protein [Halobacteriales archaeon]